MINKIISIAAKEENKETAHIILKITDKRAPLLTSYKRIIVPIIPN